MKTIYARTPLERSIFLAGPTPRLTEVASWRPEAIKLLEMHNFDGTVYVPEDSEGSRRFEYDDQIRWEWQALTQATIIVFWIPRKLDTMPGMTTNVEFGMFAGSGRP